MNLFVKKFLWEENTVKQVNFAVNLFSWKAFICKIKLPQNCEFYIDSNCVWFSQI